MPVPCVHECFHSSFPRVIYDEGHVWYLRWVSWSIEPRLHCVQAGGSPSPKQLRPRGESCADRMYQTTTTMQTPSHVNASLVSLHESNSTLESQSQNHSQKLRMLSLKTVSYGVFDCDLALTLKSGVALRPASARSTPVGPFSMPLVWLKP